MSDVPPQESIDGNAEHDEQASIKEIKWTFYRSNLLLWLKRQKYKTLDNQGNK